MFWRVKAGKTEKEIKALQLCFSLCAIEYSKHLEPDFETPYKYLLGAAACYQKLAETSDLESTIKRSRDFMVNVIYQYYAEIDCICMLARYDKMAESFEVMTVGHEASIKTIDLIKGYSAQLAHAVSKPDGSLVPQSTWPSKIVRST